MFVLRVLAFVAALLIAALANKRFRYPWPGLWWRRQKGKTAAPAAITAQAEAAVDLQLPATGGSRRIALLSLSMPATLTLVPDDLVPDWGVWRTT